MIPLIIVLGSLGYLLVGWLHFVVAAAKWPATDWNKNTGKHDATSKASPGWGVLVIGWPLVLPISAAYGLFWVLCEVGTVVFDKAALRAVRRLNPSLNRWGLGEGRPTSGY